MPDAGRSGDFVLTADFADFTDEERRGWSGSSLGTPQLSLPWRLWEEAAYVGEFCVAGAF